MSQPPDPPPTAADREFLNAIVESTTDAVFAKDLAGRYTIINAAGARFLSREVHEVLGKTDAELLSPEDAQSTVEADRQVLESGRTLEYEMTDEWRGARREWHSTKGVLRDARGEPAGIFGIAREISDRRRVEEALARSERLAAVGTLAAGMAHEVNNPLAFVLGNLSYLDAKLRTLSLEQGLHDGLLTAVAEALDGAERVRVIVQGLLATVRPEGQEPRAVDVGAALDHALSIAQDSISQRAQLVRDLQPVPPVLADEGRLVQVLINLLVNAVQSLPEGRADEHEIRVRTRRVGADRVIIEIGDTGVGIPAEHLERIFEPFFTTKRVGEGTGLGLTIAHGIVRSMGGDISVESRVGSGTQVRVTLVVAMAADEPSPEVAEVDSSVRSSAPAVRVLVIDDEPNVVSALCRCLGSRYDLEPCGGANAALALLDAGRRFDVILCDLRMPGMSGMEFHAELLTRDRRQADRVVFTTGGATPAAQAFLRGVPNRCIHKPFDLTALEALLDAAALQPLADEI